MDTDSGFLKGAQIQFFDTAFRHYAEDGTRLERFIPVDILSLAPRDDFFQPRSWRLAAGWQRMFTKSGAEPLAAGAEGGIGGACAKHPELKSGINIQAGRVTNEAVAAAHGLPFSAAET